MDTCAICQREIAPEWNFCVHCGTAVPIRATAAPVTTTVVHTASATGAESAAALSPDAVHAELDPIPSAIRPAVGLSYTGRRFDGRLLFGVAMAVVGLLVVVYAVITLLGARG